MGKIDPEWDAGYHARDEDINYLNEELEQLREVNAALENLLAARVRCDKHLPDDQQDFIKEFMNKYDGESEASLQQG